MATIRILTTACVAVFAFVTLVLGTAEIIPAAAQTAQAPAVAQTRPGRPLNLLPQLGQKSVRPAQSPARIAKTKTVTKTVHRVAQRRAPTRAFARRRHVPEIASRENDASVPPTEESLGYQAEGAQAKTQPPIDAWLRAPLPPAAPRAAARLPATTAAVSPIASPAPAATTNEVAPAVAPIPADTIAADNIVTDTVATPSVPADLSANDNVQVADAGQINEIDLAADATPTATAISAPANRTWLNGLLAILAGAFAAAATAGFLFGRRRQPKFHRSYS